MQDMLEVAAHKRQYHELHCNSLSATPWPVADASCDLAMCNGARAE